MIIYSKIITMSSTNSDKGISSNSKQKKNGITGGGGIGLYNQMIDDSNNASGAVITEEADISRVSEYTETH
jgi:hypothetical protein